jgi:hypothetical protein
MAKSLKDPDQFIVLQGMHVIPRIALTLLLAGVPGLFGGNKSDKFE